MVRQVSYALFGLVFVALGLVSCREEIPSSELPTVIHAVVYSLDNNLNLCGISVEQKHDILNKLKAQWDGEKGKQRILLEKKYGTQGDKIVTDCASTCSCSLWSDILQDSKVLANSFPAVLKAAQNPARANSQACLDNIRKVFCGSENLQALIAEEPAVPDP